LHLLVQVACCSQLQSVAAASPGGPLPAAEAAASRAVGMHYNGWLHETGAPNGRGAKFDSNRGLVNLEDRALRQRAGAEKPVGGGQARDWLRAAPARSGRGR
jgi:hypothetical protein